MFEYLNYFDPPEPAPHPCEICGHPGALYQGEDGWQCADVSACLDRWSALRAKDREASIDPAAFDHDEYPW